jgi:hypothetical protein
MCDMGYGMGDVRRRCEIWDEFRRQKSGARINPVGAALAANVSMWDM